MAKLYPAQLSSDAPPAERIVYDRLGELRADFTVIHSVNFSNPQGGASQQRKIDFLIIHPELGLLLLVVRGGKVRLVDNQWHSRAQPGNDTIIKNPYLQAQDNRAAFSRWLRQDSATSQYAMVYNRHIGFAVALPDTDVTQTNLGLASSPRKTIDLNDLNQPETAVRRVMDHAETNYQMPPQAIDALVSRLTLAQAAPPPPAPSSKQPPPAQRAANSNSFEGRVISLLAVLLALIVVAVLASFLFAKSNSVSPLTVVAQATATPVSPLTIALANPTSTVVAPPAADTPLVPTPFAPASAIPTRSTAKPTPTLQLAIGADALVNADGGLLVREQPSTDAAVLLTLGQGVKVHITDGPQQANGFTWWKIANWPQANGANGWCAGAFLSPVAKPLLLVVQQGGPPPAPTTTGIFVLSNCVTPI